MEKSVKPPFGKVIALQIVLTMTILVNVISASYAVKNIESFVSTYPNLNYTLAYVYIVCLMLTVVACFYLWQLKKFALFLLCLPLIIITAIILYAQLPVQSIYAAVAQFLLIVACMVPAWKYLK